MSGLPVSSGIPRGRRGYLNAFTPLMATTGMWSLNSARRARVGVDVDFGVVGSRHGGGPRASTRRTLVRREAAAVAGVERDGGAHYQLRSRRRRQAGCGRIRLMSRMPATKPPMWAKNAVPPCETLGVADGAHAAEELDAEPVEQHQPGGHFHGGDEDEDEDQREEAGMGEAHHVGAHDARRWRRWLPPWARANPAPSSPGPAPPPRRRRDRRPGTCRGPGCPQCCRRRSTGTTCCRARAATRRAGTWRWPR